MKLELKHICAYLPYDIECKAMGFTDTIFYIRGASDGFLELSELESVISDQWDYVEVFPLLRPMSDLIKPITHNGENFIPIHRLLQIMKGYEDEGVFYYGESDIKEVKSRGHGNEDLAYIAEYKDELGQNKILSYKGGNFTDIWDLGDHKRMMRYVCQVINNQMRMRSALLEWHFDVFKLIPNGLAIAIK